MVGVDSISRVGNFALGWLEGVLSKATLESLEVGGCPYSKLSSIWLSKMNFNREM